MQSIRIISLIFIMLFSSLCLADDFIQTYQEFLKSQKSDNTQQTLELAQKLVDMGDSKFGKSHLNTISLHYNLALAYNAAEDFQNAFDSIEIVISNYEQRYGEDSQQLFAALLEQLDFSTKIINNRSKSLEKLLTPKAKQAIKIAKHRAEQSQEKAPFIYYRLAKVINRSPIIALVKSDAKKYTELAYTQLLSAVGENDLRTLEMQTILATMKIGEKNSTES
jgi:hypothetical protein